MRFTNFLLFLLLPLTALAGEFSGKVVGVLDGDTVKVLRDGKDLEKIRLVGIDAPEKKQDFGQRSKQALSEKISGKTVKVEFKKRDRFGRLLGKILLGEEDINLGQIKNGMAWHYKQFSREQSPVDADNYAAAEATARASRTGLWSRADARAPWEFRHPKRKVASTKRRHVRRGLREMHYD